MLIVMSKKIKSKPDWLKEYKKRTQFIEILDMAFSPEYTDKQVRKALQDVAKDLGDVLMPGGKMPGQP